MHVTGNIVNHLFFDGLLNEWTLTHLGLENAKLNGLTVYEVLCVIPDNHNMFPCIASPYIPYQSET